GQFPELDHLDPGERAELLRRVPWWTYPQIILLALVGAAGPSGVVAVIAYGAAGASVAVAAFAVTAVPTAVAAYLLVLRRVRGAMRKEFAAGFLGRGPPFCFGCGFDWRAFVDVRCRVCGRRAHPG